MIRIRLGLSVICLVACGTVACAETACTPVETAPGIKSVPAGCNKFLNQPSQPKAAAPLPRRSVLFPDGQSGTVTRFGETEVRINGRVRFEAAYGR